MTTIVATHIGSIAATIGITITIHHMNECSIDAAAAAVNSNYGRGPIARDVGQQPRWVETFLTAGASHKNA